jgi:excisionase family DNA binding protein
MLHNVVASSLLSQSDAAAICGVSTRTIQRKARAGTIRTTRLGSRVYIARDEVERFQESLPGLRSLSSQSQLGQSCSRLP